MHQGAKNHAQCQRLCVCTRTVLNVLLSCPQLSTSVLDMNTLQAHNSAPCLTNLLRA